MSCSKSYSYSIFAYHGFDLRYSLSKTRGNSFDPSCKNLNQDPTLHAGDCDHSGGVKLGRTSIMEIKILNDDGTLG